MLRSNKPKGHSQATKTKMQTSHRNEVKLISDIKGISQLMKTAGLLSDLSLQKQAFMTPMNLLILSITLKKQFLQIRAMPINQEERNSNQMEYLMAF